jgi:hypothetical protein
MEQTAPSITWRDCGPPLADAEIQKFAEIAGYPLPEPIEWFLRNVRNGGRPNVPLYYVLPQLGSSKVGAHIMALLGLGHSGPGMDIKREVENFPHECRYGLPIGHSGCGDRLVYVASGENAGHIMEVPSDFWWNPPWEDATLIATSMREFAEILEYWDRKYAVGEPEDYFDLRVCG